MKRRNLVTALILTLVFGTGLTACGSGSGSSNTDGSSCSYSDKQMERFADVDPDELDYEDLAEQVEEYNENEEVYPETEDLTDYYTEEDITYIADDTITTADDISYIADDTVNYTEQTAQEHVLSELNLPADTLAADLMDGAGNVRAIFNAAAKSCPDKLVLLHADKSVHEGAYYDITRDCFWIKESTYSVNEIDGIPVIILYFTYTTTDAAAIESMQNQVYAATDEILGQIPVGADCWTKAKVIHDCLIERLTYDKSLSLPYIRSSYCLVTGDAVCVGYAQAFSWLMTQADETVCVVSNDVHCWDFVTSADAKDAYVDVTWDDEDSTAPDGSVYLKYAYFGLDYETITGIESHSLRLDVSGVNEDLESFNYYNRMGSNFDSYDYGAIQNAFAAQYNSGLGTLRVHFTNTAAYLEAVANLFGNNCSIAGQMLSNIGYIGSYNFIYNETERTISIIL